MIRMKIGTHGTSLVAAAGLAAVWLGAVVAPGMAISTVSADAPEVVADGGATPLQGMPTLRYADDARIVVRWMAPDSASPRVGHGATLMARHGVLLALPPEGEAGLRWKSRGARTVAGTVSPAIAAEWEAAPAPAVRLVELGWFRGQRLARMEFAPYRVDRGTGLGTVTLLEQIEATVDLVPPTGGGPNHHEVASTATSVRSAIAPDPLLDGVLGDRPLNAVQAEAWRLARGPSAVALDQMAEAPSAAGPVWNLHVARDGMVRVTGAALAEAGGDIAAVDPRELWLYDDGEPVDVLMTGDGDGAFDANDSLLFYGRATNSRYSTTRVYQLGQGAEPGPRMATRDVRPAGSAAQTWTQAVVRVEQDEEYIAELPRDWAIRPSHASTVDRWYGRQLSAPDSTAVVVTLPAVAPGDWTGTLRVAVVGKTLDYGVDPDHHLRLKVGDVVLRDAFWDGRDAVQEITAPLPSALIDGDTLTLTLEAGGESAAVFDQFYIDWLEVDYRRRLEAAGGRLVLEALSEATDILVGGLEDAAVAGFDISDPHHPVKAQGMGMRRADGAFEARFRSGGQVAAGAPGERYLLLSQARYAAPARIEARPATDLRDTERGADWLVISHPDFVDAVQPLATHRAALGYRVAVVDLVDVYDAFAGGNPRPEAIRDFLAYAYQTWAAPAPSMVLLVGDGTADPRRRTEGTQPTFVPPFLRVADPWLGEIASDNAYVTLVGDDLMPDMALGRLPANTPEQAADMVAKILGYETAPPPGDWQERLLFVTDEPDSAGDFYAFSDEIADNHVPADYQVEKIYHMLTHPDRTAARQAIIDEINRGVLLTQYIGHGRTLNWAVENLLRRADMDDLTNGGRLPVMLDMTCMTGRFAELERSAIAEDAVRAPNGGAIAAYSPTGFGVATGHDPMNRAFLDALLGEGMRPLGAVVLRSKLHLLEETRSHHDLVETFSLLGDPGLEVVLPFGPPTPVESTTPRAATPTPEPTAGTAPAPGATPTPGSTPEQTPTPTTTAEPERSPTAPPSETPTSASDTPVAPTATGRPLAPSIYLPMVVRRRKGVS